MKKLLFALLFFAAVPAEAKLLDTTSSLGPGHLGAAVGGEFALYAPNPIRLELHERVGLVGGLDLYLNQFVGLHRESGLRLGGGLKWSLMSRKKNRPGLALWAGGFYQTQRKAAGAAASFMIDSQFGRLTPYAALDMDMWFENGVDTHFTLLGGTRIAIVKHVAAFLEAGGGLTGSRRNHFAALGLRLRL